MARLLAVFVSDACLSITPIPLKKKGAMAEFEFQRTSLFSTWMLIAVALDLYALLRVRFSGHVLHTGDECWAASVNLVAMAAFDQAELSTHMQYFFLALYSAWNSLPMM